MKKLFFQRVPREDTNSKDDKILTATTPFLSVRDQFNDQIIFKPF